MARWVDEEYGEKVVGSSCHPGVIGSELCEFRLRDMVVDGEEQALQ